MESIKENRQREFWVDNAKAISCIMVAMGHFYKSMVAAGILSNSTFFIWFAKYLFNSPLFFFCSGYLYQKTSRIYDFTSWSFHVRKKFLDLAIPYFVFSSVTVVLKMMFEDYVNAPAREIVDVLFFHPVDQYWFLYVLFFLFLIVPIFREKTGIIIALSITGILRILSPYVTLPYIFRMLMSEGLIFVLGMAASFFRWPEHFNWKFVVAGLMFYPLSVLCYSLDDRAGNITYLIRSAGVLFVISATYCWGKKHGKSKIFSFIREYSMPIFLMHTIFAAGIRTVLFRLGVQNAGIHISLGILSMFLFPILIGWIARKMKWPEVFIYPTKIIKLRRPDSKLSV